MSQHRAGMDAKDMWSGRKRFHITHWNVSKSRVRKIKRWFIYWFGKHIDAKTYKVRRHIWDVIVENLWKPLKRGSKITKNS